MTGGDALFSYDSDGFEFSPLAGVFNILGQVAVTLFGAALIRGAFDAVDGREVTLGSMFERWDKIQVLVATLVISVLTTIGFVLCVLPGFVVIFLTWFATYFIVERGEDAVTAIKSSFSFTSEARRAAAAAGAAVASCASWPARWRAWSACWWPTRW